MQGEKALPLLDAMPYEMVDYPVQRQVIQAQPIEIVQAETVWVEALPPPPPPPQLDLSEFWRNLREDAIREQNEVRRQQQQEFTEHLHRMQAQLERAIYDTLSKIPASHTQVVTSEVPIEVIKIVKEQVAELVETVRYVDRHVEVPIERVVVKEVHVPVEITTSIVVEKPVLTEVFLEKVVTHEVPVPYDKVVIREVPMPFEVERVVEKIVEREVIRT